VWVNHSHLEKTINPWVDIKHKRDKSKIYIDLFHDPILGSSNDIGYTFDKPELRSIKDFKGDILMANDIHKRQILSTNKAYSGSLIQNNHGETIRNHGGILWKIDGKNITYEFFDIDNDEHSFITFRTQPNIDYNNINITPIEYINTK
jgi:muconolactone delta-isomerase